MQSSAGRRAASDRAGADVGSDAARLARLLERARGVAASEHEGWGSGASTAHRGTSSRGRAHERTADRMPIAMRLALSWVRVPRRSALLALAAVLLLVAGVLLRTAITSRSSQAGVAVPVASGPVASGPAASGTAASGSVAPGTVATREAGEPTAQGPRPSLRDELVVHVVGRVGKPGIVRLPAGSRVVDAVNRAGGASRAADLTKVNLARLVVDGEQVYVPGLGEAVPQAAGPVAAAASASAGSAPVNLNLADEAALDALPGVGPVLARRIIAWRSEHGSFTSVDELAEVQGIGPKVLDNLRPLVTVA